MPSPGIFLTITSLRELRALRDYLLAPEVEVIGFDTETTGLSWIDCEILSIQFSGGKGEGYTVPILWNSDGAGDIDLYPAWVGKLDKMVAILREIFGSDKPKMGHNVLFDLRMIERDGTNVWMNAFTAWGIKVNGRLIDTELHHHAIAESLPHNMTSVLTTHTDVEFYESGIKKFKKAMWLAPNDMMWEYGARDAEGLFHMLENLRPIAEDEGVDYVLDNITTPMLRVCREIEENGFPVDIDYFDRLCQFYKAEIARAEAELWAAVPHRQPGWKYNYAPELREVLFHELRIPKSSRKTDSGRGCTDCADGVCFSHAQTGKDALLEIADTHPHPVLNIILELKNLTKRRSVYLDGGRGGMKRFIRLDFRIHPSMKISRAETGRLASENPNSQNIPSYVHIHQIGRDTCADSGCTGPSCAQTHDHCLSFYTHTFGINTCNAFHDIVRAGPGKTIINIDWAALELWAMAYRILKDIGDRTLLDMLETGQDPHLWMARQMYPTIDPQLNDKEWKAAHPILRRRAKNCNFGIGYGLTEFAYAQREGVTQEEAIEIFKLYKSVVPVDRWHRHLKRKLERDGFLENEFRRRRHMPHLSIIKAMGEQRDYEAAEREGINFTIQAAGSDLHSAASFRAFISKKLRARGCKIILSVHDSLTFEADAPSIEYVKDTAWIIKTIFEETARNLQHADGTPLDWHVPVEVEFGPTWGSSTHRLKANGELEVL